MVDTCWFVFKWGALAALMAAVGLGFYFYSRVNDQIRQHVLVLWQKHYKNLQVSIRSAQLVDGEGIEIRGLTLLDPHAAGPQGELAYFDELVVYCQTSLSELIKGDPEITRVLVRRPTIHATHRPDGSWSVERMLPLPKFSDIPHVTTVENGTIELFDPLNNPPSTLTLRDINVEFKPIPDSGPAAHWATDVRGYSDGDHFQRVEFSGRLEADSKGADLAGVLTGLDMSPQLRDSLPARIGQKLAPLAPLRGQVRVGFHVHDDPSAAVRFAFQVNGQLTGGRFDDPRLPYPLSDLKADFHADNAGATVDKLTARAGSATLQLAARMHGCQPGSPISIVAKAEHLEIGRHWDSVIPEPLLTEWERFKPAGEISADLKLDFDGQHWRPEVTVHCLDVAITYFKFPYRLDRTSGTLELKNDLLTADLTAYAASQPLTIVGRFQHPGPKFTGRVDISGENLPFDQNLIAALPQKGGDVVRSLNPSGTFNFFLRLDRTVADRPPAEELVVTPNQAAVKYDRFPYPIQNIRGELVMTDGHWTFRNLEGSNGPGRIRLEGYMNPTLNGEEKGIELGLNITGVNIPLQDELRDCLSAQSASLWKQLQPRGAIDLVTDVRYVSAAKTTDIHVRAEPVGDTCSLLPAAFPYRLEKVRGEFVYRKGHIDLGNIRAIHDRTPFSANGSCDFDDDGNWHLNLDRVAVDRLRADRDLVAALPARIKKTIVDLSPSGTVNLSGSVDIFGTPNVDAPLRKVWNLSLDVNQVGLQVGPRLENINGTIRLGGESPTKEGQEFGCRGSLALDSLTFKDIQLTHVQGPIWLDNKRFLFGTPAGAPPQPGQAPPRNRVTGQLFGGRLETDGSIEQGDPAHGNVPTYSLVLALGRDDRDGIDRTADLKQIALAFGAGKGRLDGRLQAGAQLANWYRAANGQTVVTGPGIHGLRGNGYVRLAHADIYELPFMVALLKVLSIKPPASAGAANTNNARMTSAFTNSNIDYRIEGDHVYLDKIALIGDAISLDGAGEMGFDTAIKLTFRALVGRSDWQLPVVKSVLGAASGQLMQIHVDGTLGDPQMKREILPGVNKALQEVQSGVQSIDRPVTR
ncbi:MAG TPA: hypothetical protein VHX65_09810 [Pirellulales bacterium]|nr:hypothetical protein [Pirellulales bacterium]